MFFALRKHYTQARPGTIRCHTEKYDPDCFPHHGWHDPIELCGVPRKNESVAHTPKKSRAKTSCPESPPACSPVRSPLCSNHLSRAVFEPLISLLLLSVWSPSSIAIFRKDLRNQYSMVSTDLSPYLDRCIPFRKPSSLESSFLGGFSCSWVWDNESRAAIKRGFDKMYSWQANNGKMQK